MGKRLSASEIEQFNERGFVHPIRVMATAEAASYRARFEAYEREHDGWYELSKGQKLYLLQTWAAELACRKEILDAVEDVLGPDIFVWGLSLFVKDAHSPHYVSWHQDSTYWGLSSPDVVTAWIALSPSTTESGCMKMLPGSHRQQQLKHHDTGHAENLLTRGQEVAIDVDECEAALIPLQSGEISLHHILTVHASEPNRADDRRIGVAVRYIAPHVRQTEAPADSAWLVRGQDRYDHFVKERPAKVDMNDAARAEHARIMKIRQGILYRATDSDDATDSGQRVK